MPDSFQSTLPPPFQGLLILFKWECPKTTFEHINFVPFLLKSAICFFLYRIKGCIEQPIEQMVMLFDDPEWKLVQIFPHLLSGKCCCFSPHSTLVGWFFSFCCHKALLYSVVQCNRNLFSSLGLKKDGLLSTSFLPQKKVHSSFGSTQLILTVLLFIHFFHHPWKDKMEGFIGTSEIYHSPFGRQLYCTDKSYINQEIA